VLYELRGIVMLRANRIDAARIAFENSVALDDEAARPLAGLASVDAIQGNTSLAIERFDRAYQLDPTGGGEYAYSAAQLVLASKNEADAEARLRIIVQRNPDIVGARNDLAWILAEKGNDLDFALWLAEDAYHRSPSPGVLDTLGWVYFKRGEFTQAVDLLEMAAEQRPDSPSILYRLGEALGASGDDRRAKEMLERALATENFPEAEDARRALAQLEPR
jgi:tetratricopeptide (TPR) repeat protein